MRQIVRRSAFSILMACAMVLPARADEASELQAKIDGALKAAKSFVVTTLYPDEAYSATLVYVAPDRTRVDAALAANTTDVVTIGQTVYSSKNGTPFERSARSAGTEPKPGIVGSVKVGAIRPDVTTDGVSYGSFDTTVVLGKPITLVCTYEKKNYRLLRCVNDEVTQTYEKYDDPQNVVEPPKGAIDAPKPQPTKDVN